MQAIASESVLLESDARHLESKGYKYSANQDSSGLILVVIHDIPLPEAYTPTRCDLLINLPPGYPNANPDMFWTRPDVKLKNGAWPRSSEVHEILNGASWQRWSRHLTASAWRPGMDCVRTFLAAIRRELLKGV
jgi:hypothetical protein